MLTCGKAPVALPHVSAGTGKLTSRNLSALSQAPRGFNADKSGIGQRERALAVAP